MTPLAIATGMGPTAAWRSVPVLSAGRWRDAAGHLLCSFILCAGENVCSPVNAQTEVIMFRVTVLTLALLSAGCVSLDPTYQRPDAPVSDVARRP